VVIYVAFKSKLPGSGFSSIVRALVRDAAKYFLVIFTSHLALAMTLLFTVVSPVFIVVEESILTPREPF